jgi:hypothetical protein
MRTYIKDLRFKLMLLAAMLFNAVCLFAQDNGGATQPVSTSVEKTTTTSSSTANWYAAPWVWVVGGALFILLLVAIVRSGGSRSESVSRTDRTV